MDVAKRALLKTSIAGEECWERSCRYIRIVKFLFFFKPEAIRQHKNRRLQMSGIQYLQNVRAIHYAKS